jgi:hypothetical protein
MTHYSRELRMRDVKKRLIRMQAIQARRTPEMEKGT